MSLKAYQFKCLSQQRLFDFVQESLSKEFGFEIPALEIKKMILNSKVFVDSRKTSFASLELKTGSKVMVWADQELMPKPTKKTHRFTLDESWILFEDEDIIALNKPAGLPTQPTLDPKRQNLYQLLIEYLTEREGLKTDHYVGLHHRLDLETSGVILFTKAKRANKALGDAFKLHTLQKTYQAIADYDANVSSELKEQRTELLHQKSWIIKNYLKRETKKKALIHSVKAGGDYAETSFKILKRSKNKLLIEAKPKTGRMHQIRVHLSESGLPIVGDQAYLSPTRESRVMLHALRLELKHPVSSKKLTIEAKLPEDFKKCLTSSGL